MAAVWGDTFHGMDREPQPPRTRRRHRPQLEHLDDRCLLSTSTRDQSDAPRRRARSAIVAGTHWSGTLTKGASPRGGRPAAYGRGTTSRSSTELERPAGTIEAGATTAYDPIIGAAAGALDLST